MGKSKNGFVISDQLIIQTYPCRVQKAKKLCADQIKTSSSPPPPPPRRPPGIPRAFDYLLCPASGEFDLCLRGVGKIEAVVSGFRCCFFFRTPKSLTAIKHVFGRDGRVERKRYSIRERLAYKKRSLLKTKGADNDCSLVGYDRQIRR